MLHTIQAKVRRSWPCRRRSYEALKLSGVYCQHDRSFPAASCHESEFPGHLSELGYSSCRRAYLTQKPSRCYSTRSPAKNAPFLMQDKRSPESSCRTQRSSNTISESQPSLQEICIASPSLSLPLSFAAFLLVHIWTGVRRIRQIEKRPYHILWRCRCSRSAAPSVRRMARQRGPASEFSACAWP